MNAIYLVIIAAIGGIAVALQGQLMGSIDKQVGTLESVFVTYGGGGFLIGIIMILLRGGNLSGLTQVSWYTLLSGPMGLILIAAIGFSVPRLGLVPAFTILVAAQFATAAFIDQFGLFGGRHPAHHPVPDLRHAGDVSGNLAGHAMTDPNTGAHTFAPIATLYTCFKEKFGIPRQMNLVPGAPGRLVFHPPYAYMDAVRELEQFSHIWLIFIFHQTSDKPWSALVRPPRLGGNKKTGVFATRSPFRPNPIGLSAVKLEGLEHTGKGPVLHLSGVGHSGCDAGAGH